MDNDFLNKIIITDNDIDELENIWDDVQFDKNRRDIIKDMKSFDVQAFPGTGKTTVLIAKLAIIAKKWSHPTKGICVLSHTNVAREEIEFRLGNTEYGRKLLSYPHFIGTIHSFMDTFIALPWMKSNGYAVNVIDTEIALQRRFKKLARRTKDYYFVNKNLNENNCESNDYPIKPNIPCKDTTNAYTDVYECIKKSFDEGYFTFNELLYFSRHALVQTEELNKVIENRFPLLFVDEAQDTDELQSELINIAFGKDNTVIQKFGDGNQAIYSSTNSKESASFFPNEPIKTIDNSKRFSNSIAKLSDCFAICSHGMIGENNTFNKNDSKHTIFLFKKDKIQTVISKYGNLVLECFTDKEIEENSKYGVHVVGMIHNKEPIAVSEDHYPNSISDYNKAYSRRTHSKSYTPKTMLECFQLTKILDSKDLFKKIELIGSGLCRYISACTCTKIIGKSNVLKNILNAIPADKQMNFRNDFKMILDLQFDNKSEWEKSADIIKRIVEKYFGSVSNEYNFMQWHDANIFNIDAQTKKVNTLEQENEDGRRVFINFGSIHSVKGRTHLSTLVVETYWYDFNINSILKQICENKNPKISSRIDKRMKIHYVGLTRAKGLICLALPLESVSDEQKAKLKEFGWNVKEIT